MDDSISNSGPWGQGEAYEPYVGRWSRLIADAFLKWLSVPALADWLDVGCGTGALSQTILDSSNPKHIKAIDRSEAYLEFARRRLQDARVDLEVGDAQKLPVRSDAFDAAVSGLVLNFVQEPAKMVAEMKRAVRPGGVVALYVWDYAGKMQLMRHFWNAVVALDPSARELDEGRHFPVCNPDKLRGLFADVDLAAVDVIPVDIETYFTDFDDYWRPFQGGQGPAPAYAMALPEDSRERLKERLRASLPFAIDGSIPLVARAWAIKGTKKRP